MSAVWFQTHILLKINGIILLKSLFDFQNTLNISQTVSDSKLQNTNTCNQLDDTSHRYINKHKKNLALITNFENFTNYTRKATCILVKFKNRLDKDRILLTKGPKETVMWSTKKRFLTYQNERNVLYMSTGHSKDQSNTVHMYSIHVHMMWENNILAR